MMKISEEKLMNAINAVYEKVGSKFCKVDRMEQLLVEQGLTHEEAKQAVSLARSKRAIRTCHLYEGEFQGDLCYELLTDEDSEFAEELHKEFLKKRWP